MIYEPPQWLFGLLLSLGLAIAIILAYHEVRMKTVLLSNRDAIIRSIATIKSVAYDICNVGISNRQLSEISANIPSSKGLHIEVQKLICEKMQSYMQNRNTLDIEVTVAGTKYQDIISPFVKYVDVNVLSILEQFLDRQFVLEFNKVAPDFERALVEHPSTFQKGLQVETSKTIQQIDKIK